jgi:polyribonucleotide nucleotidyltransferase
MPEATRVSVDVGGTTIEFETGRLAKQASGAVVVSAKDTRVLSTATAGNLRDVDFLPLTVDVEERMYAAGKIPGSFFKREGRAGEKATLIARMIDPRCGRCSPRAGGARRSWSGCRCRSTTTRPTTSWP